MTRSTFRRARAALLAGAGAAALSLTLFGPALAQQGGGALATLGVSSGLSYQAQNNAEDLARAFTGLNLQIESDTPRQRVTLSFGGQIFADEEGVTFDNRSATLSYVYALRRQELGLTLSYGRQEINAGTIIDDVILDAQGNITGISLIADEGSRNTLDGRAFLITGQGGLIRTETALRYRITRFEGLESAEFSDSDTVDLRSTVQMQVSRPLTFQVSGRVTDTQEEDTLNTRATTLQAGLGAAWQIDRLWRANAGFDWTQVRTETDGTDGRDTAQSEGIGLDASVTRTFRTGDLRLSFAREITAVGERDQVSLSRGFDLANGGALRLQAGAQRFDGDEVQPRAEANLTRPTPDGELSFSLQQTALVAEGQNALRSRVALGYQRALSEVLALSLDGTYTAQNRLGDTTDGDQQSLNLGLAVSYAVNADWALTARVGQQLISEVGAEDRAITSVSISAGRSFRVRP